MQNKKLKNTYFKTKIQLSKIKINLHQFFWNQEEPTQSMLVDVLLRLVEHLSSLSHQEILFGYHILRIALRQQIMKALSFSLKGYILDKEERTLYSFLKKF